jgi:hypothetical protein
VSIDKRRELLESLFAEGKLALDPQAEFELRHEQYTMDMPQSGERLSGRDTMRAMQESFPSPPKGTLRRIVGDGTVWVIEGVNDYGDGDVWSFVDIVEFADDKIIRETHYYAKSFDPPSWRSKWVEVI